MPRKLKRKNKKMNANTLSEKRKFAAFIKETEAKIPTIYLSGKAAEELDRLAEEGMKEYREGKLKVFSSLIKDLRKQRKN